MRVCHVVNAVGPTTGPANHAVALVKYADVEAGILSWFDARPFDEQELLTEVTCLDAPRDTFGLDRTTYRRARDVIDRYDVVHAHHPHSGSFAKLIGRRLGKVLVSTEGSDHDKFTRKGRVANGLTNAFADRVTCVSQSVHDSFSRWEDALLSPEQVEVVYTGVDLEKVADRRTSDWNVLDETDVDPDSILVSNAARLSYVKAHETLIRAVAKADRRLDADVELVVAGDGERREFLEAEARRLDVDDRIHFPGLLDRKVVYRLMEQSDVFAMPSRWEGFCSAVLEAMAIGTPCVLSDIDSFRETFDGVALFHELEDHDSLATCIGRFATDDALRDEYAEKARRRVESSYTMSKTATDYRDLYERLLDGRAAHY